MDDSTTHQVPQAALPDPRDLIIVQQAATIARLEARIRELEVVIDELRRGGKRQAAPFSKGLPKLNPKKPGRKSGPDYGTPPAFRAMPEPASCDQLIDVPASPSCPGCGDVSPTVDSIDEQVQRDIEVRTVVRRFRIRVCRCVGCGRVRRGRHPLQTSTATGCCASQIGPAARGAMAFMNKTLGLSIGKVARCFGSLWNLDVTRGGVAHAIANVSNHCSDSYQQILRHVRESTHVTCDETGWRVGGLGAWLHTAATRDARVYVIDRGRGKDATDQLIGRDFAGTLVHDGWSPYDRYHHATHQQCLAHLLRRCHEMIEMANRGAARFPRQIRSMLKFALDQRDQRDAGERSLRSTKIQAGKLIEKIRALCRSRKTNKANDRLAGFLYRHQDQLFTFLRREGVEATNWQGEHAIRGAVVNRKVWGGNRTWAGAQRQSVLTSVLNTLALRRVNEVEWLRRTLLHQHPPLLQ